MRINHQPRLVLLAVLIPVLAIATSCQSIHATTSRTCALPQDADDALARLMAGNQRFVSHHVHHPNQSPQRRTELSAGQHPFAIVLSCSDSRVPPELIFDQGLGDLFVVRVAGNSVDDLVLGSIEYAAEHLHPPLLIVLGHEKCGAVSAALSGSPEPGKIPSVASPIAPVLDEARREPGNVLHNAIVLNAKHVADQLRRADPVLSKQVAAGKLRILAGVYDLDTGKVTIER